MLLCARRRSLKPVAPMAAEAQGFTEPISIIVDVLADALVVYSCATHVEHVFLGSECLCVLLVMSRCQTLTFPFALCSVLRSARSIVVSALLASKRVDWCFFLLYIC